MADVRERRDADNLGKLERIKPLHDKLKSDRIRVEAELALAEQELEKSKAAAQADFGTSDIGEIRRMVDERMTANTNDVERFVSDITEVDRLLKELSNPK